METFIRKLKKYGLVILVAFIVGWWFGVNFANNRPLWSNPFAGANLAGKAKQAGENLVDDTKKALRKSLDD